MSVVMTRSRGERLFHVANILFMVLISVSMLYPILNILAISFSGSGPVARGEISFYPRDFTLAAYERIIESGALFGAYGNTAFVVVLGTLSAVILTAFAAYPLTRRDLVGRRFFTWFIALTLWFNAGIIPLFLVVRSLGLLDRLIALVLIGLVNAFHVVVMRTFFQTIPDELEDSARIDGCNDIGILFRIIMPLSKPVLATVALWVAVSHWNQFFQPLVLLRSRERFTLQLVLRDIVLANSEAEYGLNVGVETSEFEIVSDSVRYGSIMVATLPILLIYPFLQRYFVKGVMIGSIKG